MLDAQIQKKIFDYEKKEGKKIPNCPLKKNFFVWFGHKTREPFGFHEHVVIIQHKLMFSKKNVGTEMT